MTLQAEGSYVKAKAMVERLGVVRPEVQKVLDRLRAVPVDIEPRFTIDATRSPLPASRSPLPASRPKPRAPTKREAGSLKPEARQNPEAGSLKP
jgi:hypothetical protein